MCYRWYIDEFSISTWEAPEEPWAINDQWISYRLAIEQILMSYWRATNELMMSYQLPIDQLSMSLQRAFDELLISYRRNIDQLWMYIWRAIDERVISTSYQWIIDKFSMSYRVANVLSMCYWWAFNEYLTSSRRAIHIQTTRNLWSLNKV